MGIHWLIFIAVLVLVAQTVLYKKRGIQKIGYDRFFNVQHAFAGEEVEMVEKITNRKLLPLPWLRLESSIQAGLQFEQQSDLNISSGDYYQNHRSLFSLAPYTEIVRRHKVVCAQRGSFFLQSATLTCGDLFGFHALSKPLKLNARLIVYPKIMEIDDILLPSHSWLGDTVVRRWVVNDPFMISGVREYRSGDTLNHLNWKATARTGALQVHNHDYTANQRLMILLNFDVTEEMWTAVTEPELIELGLSYAASIAQYTIDKGLETGFGCNGYLLDQSKDPLMILPGLGQEHLTFIYEEMAKLVIARSSDFPTFMERELINQTGELTDFLLITAFVSEKMQQYINDLRQQGHAVEIFNLHKEKGESEYAMDSDRSEKMAAGDY
jgi:uncharacterized protein (DUF58 family)